MKCFCRAQDREINKKITYSRFLGKTVEERGVERAVKGIGRVRRRERGGRGSKEKVCPTALLGEMRRFNTCAAAFTSSISNHIPRILSEELDAWEGHISSRYVSRYSLSISYSMPFRF